MSELRIIITHPHPLSTPGGGTVGCLQIAKHMERLGAEVVLVPVARGPATPPQDHLPPTLEAPPSRVHYLLDGISVAKVVRRVLAQRPVDALLGWDHDAAFLPGLLRSKGVIFGMIAAFPSYAMRISRRTSFRAIKRITDAWFRARPLRLADIVFALSSFTRKELIDIYKIDPCRVKVAYWGVDHIFTQSRRSPSGVVSRLIFFGSLAPLKGVFDAIEALGRVSAAGYRDWVLKIAGWGDEERVRQAAEAAGIGDRVVFLGRLDHSQLSRELEWAHVAVLPSRAESFGLAIAEAQAAAVPVISYAAGSVPEVVADGRTGWLVPVGRIDRLAQAIIEAIQDPDRTFRMGLAGRDRIMNMFSWERTARDMLAAIEEIKQLR